MTHITSPTFLYKTLTTPKTFYIIYATTIPFQKQISSTLTLHSFPVCNGAAIRLYDTNSTGKVSPPPELRVLNNQECILGQGRVYITLTFY